MGPPKRSLAPQESDPAAPVVRELASGRMRTRVLRFVRWFIALVISVIAIVFGVLPGIPGIPMLVVALFLIAPEFVPARRLATAIMRRFPKLRRAIPRKWRRMHGRGNT